MKKIIKKIVAVATATMTLFAFSANPHGKYGNQTKASAASYATA